MRNLKSYISLLAIGAAALTACQNDFDNIDVPVPVATIQANTTINEVKTRYWNDATNYIDTIRLNDAGEHVVISGRVISSDASGNIYKSLVIQDATGAMAMSINANSMYQKYRMGQEVVVDLTDMFIGKYNGLQQLGFPEEYQDTYEATFMPYEFFEMHAQLNGLPEPAKVDTILVNSTADLSTSPEGLRKWQSQLVRFNNCHFEQGGQVAFTDGHKVTSNRNLILSDGNSIIVRTSGYSNFWSDMLPAGNGDVVGILSYFGTSGWQLLLNDRKGCMNFGNPTIGPGAEDNPYTVTEAIAAINSGVTAKDVWTKGYIVGAVALGVTEITSNADIEFTSTPTMDNTLVIAADPTEKEIAKCLVFELPQGSALRRYGNLVDNKSNYGKLMTIQGNLGKYLNSPGITGNTGAIGTFTIEGVDIKEPVSGTIFSETFASGMGEFTIENVTLPSGVDAIWKYDSQYKYMIATSYIDKVNYDADSWLVSPVIDLKGLSAAYLSFDQVLNFFSSLDVAKTQATVGVRVVGSKDWTTLTVPTYPTLAWKPFVNSGSIDLSTYAGKQIQIGFHYVGTAAKAGTWEMNNVIVSTEKSGGDTPDNPDTPVTPGTGTEFTFTSAQFSSFTLPGTSEAEGFTFAIEKAGGTTNPLYHANTTAIRLYADNTMTISGKKMNKIVFTLSADVKNQYTTLTPSTGKINPEQQSGDTVIVWEGSASEVTFTVGHDATLGTEPSKRGQVRFTAIKIWAE